MLSKPLAAAALKPLLLSLLADGPKYGFQIGYHTKKLAGNQLKWTNSKLYPLLHKLESQGLVTSFWKPSSSGPDRKYYKLTSKGERALVSVREEWNQMHSIFSQLWSPDFSLSEAAV